ncbi:MAG: glycosyltransferase family 2 protein [Kiritimatiellaeota bacterium]|nr:glycosyltransferase family 2 protein [Kiritimatiellota bacterium]
MRSITFGIINYNGAPSLVPVIESVLGQQDVHVQEVLLVNNASTDGSLELVRRRFPGRVRIIALVENHGPNPARNAALRQAATDLVLLMDNDVVLAPDYAARLAAVCVAHPEAGAVTGQIRFHAQPDRIQYNGARLHYAGEVVVNRAVHDQPFVVATVSAGATLFDRAAALDLGPFDETLYFGWEDGDLTYRLTICGRPCYAVSQAVCWHMADGRSSRWVRLQVRNRWLFLMKYYDARTFLLALPGILLYQFCAGLVFLLQGQGGAFLMGCWDATRSIPAVRAQRRAVFRRKCVPDSHTLSGGALELPGALQTRPALRLAGRCLSAVLGGYWRLIRPFIR